MPKGGGEAISDNRPKELTESSVAVWTFQTGQEMVAVPLIPDDPTGMSS